MRSQAPPNRWERPNVMGKIAALVGTATEHGTAQENAHGSDVAEVQRRRLVGTRIECWGQVHALRRNAPSTRLTARITRSAELPPPARIRTRCAAQDAAVWWMGRRKDTGGTWKTLGPGRETVGPDYARKRVCRIPFAFVAARRGLLKPYRDVRLAEFSACLRPTAGVPD